ncbi:MAG: hypothetical protein ACRCSG_07085 [Cellulosilyticaceae bacterium]
MKEINKINEIDNVLKRNIQYELHKNNNWINKRIEMGRKNVHIEVDKGNVIVNLELKNIEDEEEIIYNNHIFLLKTYDYCRVYIKIMYK